MASVLGVTCPPAGALASFMSWAWEESNARDFHDELEERLRRIEREKVDEVYFNSDEFISLFAQATETASKTASDLKRQALAKALVNSLVTPTSELPGKQALLRVLSQMSDEEMIALSALYKNVREGDSEITLFDLKNTIEAEWSHEDIAVAYEGLTQLGLALTRDFDHELWKISTLGNRLIKWCSGELYYHEV